MAAKQEQAMSGIQKAAILLISLGPEKSSTIFKHLKAGHGVKGAKSALTLFGLNLLSYNETRQDKKAK